MVFTFVSDKTGARKEGKPVDKPVRAAIRGLAEGLGGAYGNVASLFPGTEPGAIGPGESAKISREASTQDPQKFIQELLSNATEPDILPPLVSFPTSSQIDELLTELGIPKKEETQAEKFLGRGGRLAGGAAAFGTPSGINALTSAAATIGGQAAENLGFGQKGQALAEIISSLGSSIATTASKAAAAAGKIVQPRISNNVRSASEAGFISPERLSQQLNRVNTEASEIANTIGRNNTVFQNISTAIRNERPIQKGFNKIFDQLEQTAHENNVAINSAPLDTFLTREAARYSGTGARTELGNMIMHEINGWQQNGQKNLYNIFRRYRDNNARRSEVLSNPNISKSTKNQFSNFIGRMNESINNSFQESLGAGNLPTRNGAQVAQHPWLNAFNTSNRAYSGYMNTQQARKILDPLENKNLTDVQLNKFLSNSNTWEDLDKFLGSQESGRLRETLQDLQRARTNLNSIRRKEVGDQVLRHALMTAIPGLGKAANFLSLPAAIQFIRGRYYSSPDLPSNLHNLADAAGSGSIPSVQKAINDFQESEKKSKRKKINFVPTSSPQRKE